MRKGHPGPVDLPTTSWPLIEGAAHGAVNGPGAMAEFARRYHAPVHAYVRALTHDPDLALEITQSFFSTRILNHRLLERANRAKGGFRPYLKRALHNYCVDVFRERERAAGHAPQSARAAEDALDRAPASSVESHPDAAFHLAWVRQLLAAALERVRMRCAERGQSDHFEIFTARYLSAEDCPWAELGERHGLGEKAARGHAETVARHFRGVLRELMVVETGSPAAADEEIAMLLAQF